jgi:3-methyladenine DNA glycosylase AlkD
MAESVERSVPSPDEVLHELRAAADPANVEGMVRFGISAEGTLGVSMPVLRDMARDIKRTAGRGEQAEAQRHDLAGELWDSGVHEARILAALVDAPVLVSEEQMETWVAGIDSWDVCDQVCSNLFDETVYAYPKAFEWAGREEEFVKRAGFVLMAMLAVHDKEADDSVFLEMLPVIEARADDGRNFVKKAINWALRQIGKRNRGLNAHAVEVAERLVQSRDPVRRWVGKDAYRELTSKKVLDRLQS